MEMMHSEPVDFRKRLAGDCGPDDRVKATYANDMSAFPPSKRFKANDSGAEGGILSRMTRHEVDLTSDNEDREPSLNGVDQDADEDLDAEEDSREEAELTGSNAETPFSTLTPPSTVSPPPGERPTSNAVARGPGLASISSTSDRQMANSTAFDAAASSREDDVNSAAKADSLLPTGTGASSEAIMAASGGPPAVTPTPISSELGGNNPRPVGGGLSSLASAAALTSSGGPGTGAMPAGVYSPFQATSGAMAASSGGLGGGPGSVGGGASTLSSRGSSPDGSASHRLDRDKPFTHNKPMTAAQHKHATTMLRAIKRLKDAHVFLHPVDPVRLNIPDYPLIIKQPMDLSTMEKKLAAREYFTPEALASDFHMMLDNCIKYNGPQSVFATMANNLRKSFERHMEKMPSASEPSTAHTPSSDMGTPVVGNGSARKSTASKSSGKTPRGNAMASKATGPRRPSQGGAKIETGSPMTISSKKSSGGTRRLSDELKFCYALVKEFSKKQHSDYAYPFLAPVDRKLYPQYYEVIKNPMDLATIRTRLEEGHYNHWHQFEHDMEILFKNCFKFNPAGTPVRMMGQKLEALFKQKWAERPPSMQPASTSLGSSVPPISAARGGSTMPPPSRSGSMAGGHAHHAVSSAGAASSKSSGRSRTKPKPMGPPASSYADRTGSDSDSSDDDLKPAIQQMEVNLQMMQQQLEMLRKQQKERKRKKREARLLAQQKAQMQHHGTPSSVSSAASRVAGGAMHGHMGARGGSTAGRSKTSSVRGAHPGHHPGGHVVSPTTSAPPPSHESTMEVTYEMKRELSEKINDLSPEKLQQVLAIIQESMPQLSDGTTDEIELDIASLDNQTLYRLWQLVTEESARQAQAARSAAAISSKQGMSVGSAAPVHMSSMSHPLAPPGSVTPAPLPPGAAQLPSGPSAPSTLHKGPTALSSVVRNSSDEEGSDSESSSSGSDSD